VKPTAQLFAPRNTPRASHAVICPVAGFGIVQAAPDVLAALRRNPVPLPGAPVSPSFLKHADEQTVVGIAAVYQAIHNHNLAQVDFRDWGVVGAPCFLGRGTLAQALKRLAVEGAWGVSPHLIPHHSVHAVSGTVSQALGIHGPNFGVGGGPHAVAEALTIAATLVADRELPGLWVVLTEYEPEFIPADPSAPSAKGHHAGPLGVALALALVPRPAASIGMSLHICPQAEPHVETGPADWTAWTALETVSPLAAAFSQNGFPGGKWRFGLNGWMELTSTEIGAENPR
jgi:hypothetical protein